MAAASKPKVDRICAQYDACVSAMRETRKHATRLISGDRNGRGKDAAVHGRSEVEVDVVVMELVHHKRFEAAVDE